MIALKEEAAIIRSFIFIKFTHYFLNFYNKVDDVQQVVILCKAWKVIKNEVIKL